MSLLVHQLDKVPTSFTFISLTSAKVIVVVVLEERDSLAAELTRPWLLGALLGVLSVLMLRC